MSLPTSSGGAQKIILTSLVVTGGLAVVDAVAAGHVPAVRIGVGLTVAGVMLSAFAEVSPQIAGGLAALMGTSAVFVYGAPAWSLLSGGAVKPAGSKPDALQPLTP